MRECICRVDLNKLHIAPARAIPENWQPAASCAVDSVHCLYLQILPPAQHSSSTHFGEPGGPCNCPKPAKTLPDHAPARILTHKQSTHSQSQASQPGMDAAVKHILLRIALQKTESKRGRKQGAAVSGSAKKGEHCCCENVVLKASTAAQCNINSRSCASHQHYCSTSSTCRPHEEQYMQTTHSH